MEYRNQKLKARLDSRARYFDNSKGKPKRTKKTGKRMAKFPCHSWVKL